MMTMYEQFPRIWYVSPYGLGLLVFRWREAAFPDHQIAMGCPLPSLTLTSLSVGA